MSLDLTDSDLDDHRHSGDSHRHHHHHSYAKFLTNKLKAPFIPVTQHHKANSSSSSEQGSMILGSPKLPLNLETANMVEVPTYLREDTQRTHSRSTVGSVPYNSPVRSIEFQHSRSSSSLNGMPEDGSPNLLQTALTTSSKSKSNSMLLRNTQSSATSLGYHAQKYTSPLIINDIRGTRPDIITRSAGMSSAASSSVHIGSSQVSVTASEDSGNAWKSNSDPSIAHGPSDTLSPKIKKRFDAMQTMIDNELSRQLNRIDTENSKLVNELDSKYRELCNMTDHLQRNVKGLKDYSNQLTNIKVEKVHQLNTSDLFTNLSDLESRLDAIKKTIVVDKDRLSRYTHSIDELEEVKRRNLVAQKTRGNIVLVILGCFVLLLGIHIVRVVSKNFSIKDLSENLFNHPLSY